MAAIEALPNMAATQAEPQQNEVNRDIVQQEQPQVLGNTGLQNGTEKSSGRGLVGSEVAGSKGKIPGQNNLPVEMSQYRQESGAGPPIHNSEQNANSSDDVAGKINNSENKSYSLNSEQSGGSEQNYGKGPSDSGNQNIQGYGLSFPQRGNYHPEHPSGANPMQISGENSIHQTNSYGQFNPQNMRHGYPGSKPMSGPPRPPSAGPNMNSPSSGFPPHGQQQRFLSGQSISQPTGPTPTLNQLLQSSNPVHRYQNSYGDYSMQKPGDQPQGSMPYNQSWPPPRQISPYGPQQGSPGYRSQPSGGRGNQAYLSGGGSPGPGYPPPQPPPSPSQTSGPPGPPSAGTTSVPGQQYPPTPAQAGGTTPGSQYPPYPQRYPTPPTLGTAPTSVPPGRPTYPPHQLGPAYGGGPQPPPTNGTGSSGGGNASGSAGTGGGNSGSGGSWPPPVQHPPSPSTGGTQLGAPPPQPSPQPPPQPSPQPPPPSPQQQQTFPSRPQQSSTPNAHAPDTGDLTGQNSNDSSSGPAPGTPNSQGMRPTPSPTGSTGSRSMSPAVGQQNIPMPPRPSSSQSDGGSGPGPGPTRMSHSPMATQGGYQQQQLGPPPHMHNFKMGPSGMVPQGAPPHPSYSSQQQYPQQGNYSPRPQGQLSNMQYAPNQTYGGQNPQGAPGNQYPTRPMPNHVPHSQFGGYQGWGSPMNQGPPGSMMGATSSNHLAPGGKGSCGPVSSQGAPPPPGNATQQQTQPSNASPSPRSHTPPHQAYLKQHLQHKVGFASGGSGMPPSPGSYSSNSTPPGMGPPHHHPMGPPHHPGMGPPPTMGPPNSHAGHHEGGPMPPPSSTPNSHPGMGHVEVSAPGNPPGPVDLHDNGITTTATGTVMTSVSGSTSQGGVTSLVTTGPDGAPMDEASQQSTLSNASAASGEDPSCTPGKSRKDGVGGGMYPHSHPTTPQSTAPSPGAASLNSMHEEYPQDNSPTWPRTPASPVYNSHVPQDLYRPKKHDSLGKLYEMDDSHERRLWLDKLLQFMEDRGTPISACPTISKNPLDLFRLYLYVKERGGFMEVCKVQCSSMVTKNKIWKDIAGLLGIGASSSAAYTLRKHYTKNLLPFECHFDRGGIDPQPIINQVEASSKKKSTKTAPVPSPGSSNSQDSFPAGGSSGSMDGYSYGYPPDYNNQRPPSQSNQGMQGGYQGQGGYSQYPEQYNQQYPAGGSYPPNRPMYPPYGPDTERGYNQGTSTAQSSGNQGQAAAGPGPDPYNRYMGPGQPPGYPPRAGYGGPQPPGPTGTSQQTPPGQPPNQGYPPPPGGPPQQDYYRQEQVYPGQVSQNQGGPAPAAGAGNTYPGAQPNKSMPPPAPQPRRHPDFAKDQQPYPPYNQQRPAMYGGWSNANNNQYRGQFGGQAPGVVSPGPQQWNQGPARPPASGQPPSGPPGQWDQQRYPPAPNQPPYQSPQQWGVPSMGNSGVGPNSALRPPMGPRPGYRPDNKQFNQMPPSLGLKGQPGSIGSSTGSGGGTGVQSAGVKRELVFPLESVEAVTPVLYKRRRLGRADVAPVEAWRLMMALRSGLLAETTWALDVLNILLFDDTSIAYFGLAHMPGLLDVLLEHFRRALSDMLEPNPVDTETRKWYEKPTQEVKSVDLGCVTNPPDPADRVPVIHGPDHTLKSRRGAPVITVPANDELFITDTRRPWDTEEPEEGADLPDNTKYIIPCFRGEFGVVPFVRVMPEKSEVKEEVNSEDDENKRTKTVSDVLTRIKKEPKDNNERVRDPAGTLKRRRVSDYEDECYSRDEASLYLVTESQDAIARRCICLSTILRNLTFVPGNESEFAKNATFLGLLGKLLLLHHEHPVRTQKQRNYDRDDDADCGDCCSSLHGESEWWWEFLHHLRENALVCIANMAGHVDLGPYSEDISRPLLDGLLHWAVCPAAQGQDAFPTVSTSSLLSPQRLALEALCKLCVTDANVDLVIATPPYSRLDRLCAVLTRLLCRSEEQVLREFSVNLLHYLAAADSGMARTIAVQSPCVSLLVAFIEQAEASALGVANQHGIAALRDNPDCMGTSLDMLRRAARTLLSLAKHPDNRALFLQQEQRLLALVMSQILDQQVAAIIARVLYHCSSRSPSPAEQT